ncbi:hypothetical protein AB0N17_03655 [Streptomyces sp. NPDC051133]|uniref:hypothetical protein n=1 Tax=Streptomyces sp. NPDC051133 TaxID=3155521 RepID=UPI00343A9C54
MKKLVGKNHEHPDGHLMGRKVQHDGEEYTVVGLQSGTAVISKPDGFKRHKPIHELRNNG